MKNKIIYVLLILISSKSSFAQSSFIPGSCYHPSFILDTTHKVNNEWRYITKEKDSLFLDEVITIKRYEVKLKSKKFDKYFNTHLEKLGDAGTIFYTEILNKGTSNHKPYYDYIFYRDFGVISLNYNRDYYYANPKNIVHVYTINYDAKMPRNWSGNEKWESSIPHFLEKISSIKQMYNRCKIFD